MRTCAIFLTFVIAFALVSCEKHGHESCGELKEAAYSNNVQKVSSLIQAYIRGLPSTNYNEQNIQLLTQCISKCDISSTVFCFDCIKTLPSQTEISLDFNYNGTAVRKVIDLSYSPDKKIVFKNMHD